MHAPTPKRRGRRAALATAAAGGGLAAPAAGAHPHLGSLAHDQEYRRVSAPLGGRPFRVASADGTSLYAEAFGPDSDPTLPAMVLAHGWTEQLSFWGPVIKHLESSDLRLIAFDLRGHGRSAPGVDADYGLERFGEDVDAIVRAADSGDGRVTVVGHSLGAM